MAVVHVEVKSNSHAVFMRFIVKDAVLYATETESGAGLGMYSNRTAT